MEFFANADLASIGEIGAVSGLVLVVYGLIDKVLVPLVAGKKNGHSTQAFINQSIERRFDKLEQDIHDMRGALQDVGKQAAILDGILKRIDQQLDKLDRPSTRRS